MPLDWLRERASDLRYRVRSLFRRDVVERELDDELHFHLAMETEKLRREGHSPAEAARRARLAFGGVDRAKEASRDGRGVRPLETFAQDLRYAVRGLLRTPGFTLAVTLTLGLGIGVNAAMFGVVDRLLFRAPAYLAAPGETHRVYLASQDRDGERIAYNTEFARLHDLRRFTTAFSTVAGFRVRPIAVGDGGDAREISVATVSASYFDLFEARPTRGRFFGEAEDALPAGAPVVVLSDAYWRTHFGARPDVIGSTLRVGHVLCTVIGVAPPGFAGVVDGAPPSLFMPITTFAVQLAGYADASRNYSWSWLSVLVRRKPGVTPAQANADLSDAYRRSWEAERATGAALPSLEVARPRALAAPVALDRGPRAREFARVALWVGGVAVIVLLVACANVANLLLTRALGRQRELALRLALGAGRSRLAGQLLAESLVLAVLGGAAGVLAAQWGGVVLGALFLPQDPGAGALRDPRTIAWAAIVTLATALLTGFAPAFQASRRDPAAALRSGRTGTAAGGGRARGRAALLVVQAALSMMLLVGAGLFLRSLENVRTLSLGYEPDPVVAVYMNRRGVHQDEDDEAARRLGLQLEEGARALPIVEYASAAASVPLMDTWSKGFSVPGIDSVRRLGRFTFQAGTSDLFRTLGTRIVQGRAFTPVDRLGAPLVAVVSEGAARALWPGQPALGQCIRMGGAPNPCTTVVGVAENIKATGLDAEQRLQVYLPIQQADEPNVLLLVRVRGDAAAHTETVRRALQPLMPGASYLTAYPLRDAVREQSSAWRLGAMMFLAFGALAVLVAAVGLYGVLAFDVAQRTRELGIRTALGARARDLARLVLGNGLRLAALGIALGTGAALLLGPRIAPLLFGVSPTDPLVLGAAATVVLLVAGLATLVPARRAARVDPGITLRTD